jgi:regulator of protease activity HflC (stomatin/prohibitin superfamily)
MPRARDLLARFRPVGAPGAATPPGVPADRRADRERELRPVFEQLEATEAEAAHIRAEGSAAAAAAGAAADDQAAAIVAAAHRQADAYRANAAAGALRRAAEDAAVTHAEAVARAATVARRAEQRLPQFVAGVVRTMVLDDEGAPS